MSKKLAPYGSQKQLQNVTNSGLVCKAPAATPLISRMPSREVAAKIGVDKLAAKNGCRVIRRNRKS